MSTTPKRYDNFINGQFVQGNGNGSRLPVINPATEETISDVPDSTQADVDAAVEAATKAQKSWGKLPPIQRAGYLREISAKIREKADFLARVISEEQGKTL